MTNDEQTELLRLLILEDRLRTPKKLLSIRHDKRYKFAWGGRGGAKSESFAKELLRRADEKKLRILCAREIQNSITDSVHSLLSDLIKSLDYTDYKVTDTSIENLRTGSKFIFKGLWQQEKKQTIKSLANINICWVEEAQSMSKKTLDLLDPTIRKKGSEMWFSFNRILPDDPIWMFKESIDEDDKIEINVNYYDNPYLPKELKDQAERSKREYDAGQNEDYLHIWEGDPAAITDSAVMTVREVQQAMDREVEPEGQEEVGVDVARFGNDRTVFFKRKGMKVTDYRVYRKKSVPEIIRLLTDFVGVHNTSVPIKVDDTGVGGGVTDGMAEDGYNVIPINFGARAKDPNKYNNLITEMWFELKEMIGQVDLPDIQELRSELTTREYKIDMKSRKQIESKDQFKKRYGKSPDLADALLLCFAQVGSSYYIQF